MSVIEKSVIMLSISWYLVLHVPQHERSGGFVYIQEYIFLPPEFL